MQQLLVTDVPSPQVDVKYQGPVESTTLVSYDEHPSPDQERALPKRDQMVQICQSDLMLEWLHSLATISVMKEARVD